MNIIKDLSGFRCTSHEFDKMKILTGKFDIYNPCSYCSNLQYKLEAGPAFHYVTFGRWEFPFVAEANCKNYSIIRLATKEIINFQFFDFAKKIHEVNTGMKLHCPDFNLNWWELKKEDNESKSNIIIPSKKIIYPNELSAEDFFREASYLRSDFFGMKQELRSAIKYIEKDLKIKDTKLDEWLTFTGNQMGKLTKQIDYIESNISKTDNVIFSKWAIKTVRDGFAWDSIKFVASMVRNLIIGI
jgi:hypothetical protein